MTALSNGTEKQKAMAQDATNRFWWPALMMFGPSDKDSIHSSKSMTWKIKRESNDVLRQQFVDRAVPQGELIGITFPDSDLKWNEETGHYDFGEIDWAEFKNVINGNGPCNKERIRARIKADEEGRWVRDAALAYAKNK